MKSTFRPVSPGDSELVSRFLSRAFNAPEDAPFLNPALMAWKYFDRRDDWNGPRAYILERDGVVTAHAGIWPVTFDNGQVTGVHMIDWASAAESPGAGLALVQKLASLFDFIYAIGGSDMTRKALPAFGFVECARQWNGALPLRPLRQVLTHQYRNWKLAPRLARNYLWSMRKRGGDDAFEEISSAEIPNASDAHFSPRPGAFFDYLLRCPAAKIHLYRMRGDRIAKGHFVLAVVRGQARIAGIWMRSPVPEDLQSAFSTARRAAMTLDGVYELAAAGTEGWSESAAKQAGLRMVEHLPVYLLNKKGKLALPPDFQFQLCDNDCFFLDSGEPSYWT